MEITPEIQALLDAQKAELTATFEESVSGLRKSQQDLLAEKKAAKDEAERIKLEKAAQNKDVETLSKSYEDKLQAERDSAAAIKAENEKLLNGIKHAEIGRIAGEFVSSNVVDDAFIRQAMTDTYSKRIDIRDGKPVVLDPEGNLTALTIADLNKEIKGSSVYANHIRASHSTGGGAAGSKSSGARATQNLNGNNAEKASALAGSVPGFADLPVR